MNQEYKRQVALLLDVLPVVAEENNLALHGGTAINLFVSNMPRLSVDIDLTYLPVAGRATSLKDIAAIIKRIQEKLELRLPTIIATPKPDIGKLLVSRAEASIKLEINFVQRGVFKEPESVILCDDAQEAFDAFIEIKMVPVEQLYGGKICAALDRQHPRDLFDIKYLLEQNISIQDLKAGFIYCLLGSERPLYEILNPHRLDQQDALQNQFEGMTSAPFTYSDYEETREKLIDIVQGFLTPTDKEFLLGFKGLMPDWSIYPYEQFPSIKWKLLNLQKLKDSNPQKYQQQFLRLKEFLKS